MIRASTPDAIRRRKTNAAVIGGCSAVAALTAIGFTAVCGGFDRYKNSSAAEVNDESAPKVLRGGHVLELVQAVAPSSTFGPSMGPSVRPSETPSIAWQPSGSSVPSFRPSRSMAPYLQPSSTPTPTETETPSGFPTATESLEPTDLPTATMIGKPVSVEPTEYPVSLAPSASATTDGPLRMRLVSEAPTMTNAPSVTPTVSHSPTDLGSKGTFRLRMHWQPGYLWQELPEEDWFCVACAVCDPNKDPLFGGLKNCDLFGDCEEDMQLALTRCKPTSLGPMKLDEIVTFKFLHGTAEDGLEGDQLQIFGTNLCVSTVKTEDNIKSQEVPGGNGSLVLKPCDSSLESQRFWGGRSVGQSVGQAFELLPLSGKRLKCLTNHHHPRQEEQIYSEDCDLARKPDTSLWCPFFPEHDTIGSCETVTASPTIKPTRMPVTSKPSTARPTRTPTNPPTPRPTKFPTPPPTSRPTKFPTLPPTSRPTKFPTLPPTSRPTKLATVPPTSRPTKVASEPAPAALFN